MSVTREPWGEADGRPVELYTLNGSGGLSVKIATYGALVQSIWVPDGVGRSVNVALGFATLTEYVANYAGTDHSPSGTTHFGGIVGRYANRIARHSFTLDGKRYELAANDDAGGVTLHGGPGGGYGARVWEAAPVTDGRGAAVRLRYVDPDGTNGFPGTVENEVAYDVTSDNSLRIEYRARTDAPTVINLTNHTYFNLAGEGSGDVYDQLLAVNAGEMLPVDQLGIPVGFAGVAGTPFDFRTMKPLGQDLRAARAPLGDQLRLARGFDHQCVLRGSGYRLAAVASAPASGIALWAYTDRPGVQLYTANHLAGDLVGTSGRAYRQGDGFALETQCHPDAPNHIGEVGWPDVVLRPGRQLVSRTTYGFSLAGPELRDRIQF